MTTPDEVEPERPKYQRLAMLVTGISIILTAILAISILQTPTTKVATKTTEQFRHDMAALINSKLELDLIYENISAAKTHLDKLGYPTFTKFPEQLSTYRTKGCKAIDWEDQKVSLISTTNKQDQPAHLFIINRESLTDNNLQTTDWQDEQNTYFLITQ